MQQLTPQGTGLYSNMQALRGIAALLVCCHHFRISLPESWRDIAFENGWIGVQIFFMISGFIMVHTTMKIKDDFKMNSLKFMLKRIIRIVPLYYLVTLLYIADDIKNENLSGELSLLVKSLLFIPSFITKGGPYYGMPLLEVGWTLNYEMIFYSLFAVSILWGTKRYWFVYAIFTILVFIIPILYGFSVSNNYNVYRNYPFEYLNFLTNPIWLHFILGVTLGLILPKLRFNTTFVKISLPIGIILFSLYYFRALQLPFNAVNDLIFCGILMISFLLNDMKADGIQLPKPMVILGNISFSIYLLHPLLFSYQRTIFEKLNLHSYVNTTPYFVLAIITTIFIAALFYFFFELKVTNYLKKVTFNNIWNNSRLK